MNRRYFIKALSVLGLGLFVPNLEAKPQNYLDYLCENRLSKDGIKFRKVRVNGERGQFKMADGLGGFTFYNIPIWEVPQEDQTVKNIKRILVEKNCPNPTVIKIQALDSRKCNFLFVSNIDGYEVV